MSHVTCQNEQNKLQLGGIELALCADLVNSAEHVFTSHSDTLSRFAPGPRARPRDLGKIQKAHHLVQRRPIYISYVGHLSPTLHSKPEKNLFRKIMIKVRKHWIELRIMMIMTSEECNV